jgi:hypothetical protein
MRRSNRDLEASRAVIALIGAGARVGRTLEREVTPAGLSVPTFNVLMELAASAGGVLTLRDIGRRRSKPNAGSFVGCRRPTGAPSGPSWTGSPREASPRPVR